MTGNKRGGRGKVGLAASGALALVLGLGIAVDALNNERIGQIDARHRVSDHADAAWIDVNPACVADKLSPLECGDEVAQLARPEQRAEYDLEAQRTMAAWTRAMGMAALIGMAVGIFGLGLIYRTWDATRQAAASSGDTLKAYLAKERAHIKANSAQQTFGKNALDPTFGFSVTVKNVGLSAGTIQRFAYKYVEDFGWKPDGLNEISVSDLLPSGMAISSPLMTCTVDSTAFTLLGYFDYTSLETIAGRTYFCFTVYFVESDGLGPAHWKTEQVRPVGMPTDL